MCSLPSTIGQKCLCIKHLRSLAPLNDQCLKCLGHCWTPVNKNFVVQVLLPSITEQEPPPQQPPQQQPASSGGIGSWLWGTMAGPAPPTPQPPQPFPETPAQQPPQVPSPTPLNETSAPQQPFQDSTQHQEHHAVQDPQQGHDMPHDAGPSSPAYRLHRDLSSAQESSMYDTASSQDVDSAARHVALQQAFANHQAQVGIGAIGLLQKRFAI